MSKIRVAVVGGGGIGGAHLRAYAAHPDLCEIVGVADVNLSAAEEKAAQYGAQAFADYETMLAELTPDAISICTPPALHLPVVQAARNIPILCEKPPARTVAETQQMVEATRNGFLQFAFCHRFHQSVNQAQAMIAAGQLGKIVQVYNRFGFRFDRAGKSWFTEREMAGGGVLIDTLVHSIDIFHALLGEETSSVSASISTALPNIDVEDSASILVTSASGVAGSLNCSWVTPVSEAEIRIYGTEGEAVIDYAQKDGLRYRLASDTDWTQLPFDQPDRFVRQAEHFLKSVAAGTPPSPGAAEALAVMRVIEGAYRAAESGSRIAV